MPTDNVKNRTFKDLLGNAIRFRIPFFQRGYAWEKKHWDTLFNDVQEQLIQELQSGSSLSEVEHFFGPIVVMEQLGTDIKEFLVIDGQQRITTVYLLLGIIQEQMKRLKHVSTDAHAHLSELKGYVTNNVGGADDYMKLKVFSSKGDRLPTYRVVFGTDANPKTPYLQIDQQLYVPGKNRVDAFLKYATKKVKTICPDVPALWQLAQALLNCLTIVWIPLDPDKDDEQAIFESLNDKGMPLSASELLCNYLFRPIIGAKENPEDLHNNQWLAAIRVLSDDDDLFEEYLRTLFSIGENKMVGKARKVYVHFKGKNRNLTAAAAKQLLKDIHSGAGLYLSITDPLGNCHQDDAINKILIAIGHTRMESSSPFVLAVLRAHAAGTLTSERARAILQETLVLLVRRKMTELPTTKYNAMFPQLLGKISSEPKQIRALQEQFKSFGVWVSDQEFEEALKSRPGYREQDRPFSRMLLMELDKKLQAHGQLPEYSTVNTIEHVMPQDLDSAWKAYLGEEAGHPHLPAVIQTIGNLCLLSGPANSAVGQDPFEAKKASYSPLTALARQIKEHDKRWDMAAIRARSQKLAKDALGIWAWTIV